MKKLISTLVGLTIFAAFGATALAQIIIEIDCTQFSNCIVYVNENYNGQAQPIGSKSAPYNTITQAVNKVMNEEDFSRIYIAGGTYDNETYPWDFDTNYGKTVQFWGGYNSSFTERNPATNKTRVIGNGANQVLRFHNSAGTVDGLDFSGFTGVGNNTDLLIDAYIDSPTSFSLKMNNNVFHDNEGHTQMAIVSVYGSNTASITNNTFYSNQTSSTVSNTDSALLIRGNVSADSNLFYANQASNVLNCSEEASFTNNFVLGNITGNTLKSWECDIYHNTVVNNEAGGINEAAVMRSIGASNIVNNIFAHNGGPALHLHTGDDDDNFDYNVTHDNENQPSLEGNNTDCDPLFADENSTSPNNVKLGAGSVCVDAGTELSSINTDYFGITRPADGDGVSGAASDPGAHEAPDALILAPTLSQEQVSLDPFSPDGDGVADSTTLSFELSVAANVDIGVYDSTGATLMKSLMDGAAQSAGTVSVVWDGTETSGTTVPNDNYLFVFSASNSGGTASGDIAVQVLSETTDPTPNPDPSGQCAGYSDVPASHPSCDAIEYAQSIGAMTGNPDGTFAPNELLQRDQVAKISLETFGLFDDNMDYCNGTDPFPDVPPAQWSYQYICRGVDVGMITGYEGGADAGFYRPARQVNRVEFLALILRNLSDTMPADSSTSYSDVEANQWFSGYARYSLDNDLFAGPNLMPTNGTKRVEVADVLYKLHNLGKI